MSVFETTSPSFSLFSRMRESKFGKWVKCVDNVSLWGSYRRERGKRPVSVSFFSGIYITRWAGPKTIPPPLLLGFTITINSQPFALPQKKRLLQILHPLP